MKKIQVEFSEERLITPSGLVFVGQILGIFEPILLYCEWSKIFEAKFTDSGKNYIL